MKEKIILDIKTALDQGEDIPEVALSMALYILELSKCKGETIQFDGSFEPFMGADGLKHKMELTSKTESNRVKMGQKMTFVRFNTDMYGALACHDETHETRINAQDSSKTIQPSVICEDLLTNLGGDYRGGLVTPLKKIKNKKKSPQNPQPEKQNPSEKTTGLTSEQKKSKYSERFEAFWQIYQPARGNNKPAAARAFEKATKAAPEGLELNRLIAAQIQVWVRDEKLVRCQQSKQGYRQNRQKDRQGNEKWVFIPHCSSWLNSAPWEDESLMAEYEKNNTGAIPGNPEMNDDLWFTLIRNTPLPLWKPEWGPKLGETGCRVPESVIQRLCDLPGKKFDFLKSRQNK